MTTQDNDHHLDRILVREAFEKQAAGKEAGRAQTAAEAWAERKREALNRWVALEGEFEAVVETINRSLSGLGAALVLSANVPHDYSHAGDPLLARGRMDLYENGKPTPKYIECNLTESGIVYFYMFLPKGTKRSQIPMKEVDADRIEAILLDFVDLALN
ncbi:hypothetical protein ACFOYU_13590 [Microvirga sp. GCM10011540]|uniref:hypothetical protein n=1 Tax=Microvirga sp. GCM10011540 TaxID=3317338 RepID=UPI0036062B3E